MSEGKDIDDPVLFRKRKHLKQYEDGEAPNEYDETPVSMYKRIYYEALDFLITSITTWFNQPGYHAYCCLQNLLLAVVNKDDYSVSLEEVLERYQNDISVQNLETQLQILACTVPAEINSIAEILSYLSELAPADKELIKEVLKLAKLVLVMPATNSTSERSFKAIRRVKFYLKSTMSQQRLNHLMVLHVHREHTDNLNMTEVANEFVKNDECRSHIFGLFTELAM